MSNDDNIVYRQQITDFVAYLNNLLLIDRKAISKLVSSRVECTKFPKFQTITIDKKNYIGIVGIMNGFFGTINEGKYKGQGHIAIDYVGEDIEKFVYLDETSE